jgi:hypothetical protein
MASLRKPVEIAATEPVAPNAPPAPPAAPEPTNDAEQALRRQLEALQHSEEFNRQQQAIATAEGRRRAWVESNPVAQKFYNHLGQFHNEAIQFGLADTSPQYFEHMENQLAALHSQQPATAGAQLIDEMRARSAPEQPAPQPRQRTNIVSAPVSRDIPSSGQRQNGTITLNAEQKEFARLSKISETEYARQLLRLRDMQLSGEYSERR